MHTYITCWVSCLCVCICVCKCDTPVCLGSNHHNEISFEVHKDIKGHNFNKFTNIWQIHSQQLQLGASLPNKTMQSHQILSVCGFETHPQLLFSARCLQLCSHHVVVFPQIIVCLVQLCELNVSGPQARVPVKERGISMLQPAVCW